MSTSIPSETRIITCPNCGGRNRVKDAAKGAPHCGVCDQPLPWLASADESSFDNVARGSTLPVLIDFWAPWCGPCRMVSPAVERLASQLAGQLKVVKVNTDDSPTLSGSFGITGIPTLVLMDQGKETNRMTGALPENEIRRWLEASLASRATS